ncbi:MAG: Ig-like domain-containing protein [Beijerinckiaceae bacterium]
MVRFVILAAACLVIQTGSAAACKIQSNFDFGYNSTATMALKRGTRCGVSFNVAGYAFEGISVVTAPRNGTVQISARNTFAYTPKAGFSGKDTFVVEVRGGGLNSNSGVIAFRAKTLVTVDATVTP